MVHQSHVAATVGDLAGLVPHCFSWLASLSLLSLISTACQCDGCLDAWHVGSWLGCGDCQPWECYSVQELAGWLPVEALGHPRHLTSISRCSCWRWINNYLTRLNKICWFVSGEQIIDLRDTDKSQYFVITKFNNCFIIQSLFFWSTKDVKSLSDKSGNRPAIFAQERAFNHAWAEYYLQQNTNLWAVICRSRGALSANEKEGKCTSNDNDNYLWLLVFFLTVT